MWRLVLALAIPLGIVLAPQLRIDAPSKAWAVGSPPGAGIEHRSKPLTHDEARKIEAYLRTALANPHVRLAPQPPEADVYVGDRLIGVVYPDDEKGTRTFYFEMAIFPEDLDHGPPAGSRR